MMLRVESKYDLIKYDKLGRVSPNMFTEDWLRFVIKMATGSGKTKVMSLILTWAYFHKMYEEGFWACSKLSLNNSQTSLSWKESKPILRD